jgi:hypothetical protein
LGFNLNHFRFLKIIDFKLNAGYCKTKNNPAAIAAPITGPTIGIQA